MMKNYKKFMKKIEKESLGFKVICSVLYFFRFLFLNPAFIVVGVVGITLIALEIEILRIAEGFHTNVTSIEREDHIEDRTATKQIFTVANNTVNKNYDPEQYMKALHDLYYDPQYDPNYVKQTEEPSVTTVSNPIHKNRLNSDWETVQEIRDNFNIKTKSLISAKELNLFLKGTALEGLGEVYKDAEEKYGINAIYLCAVSCLESGFGTSNIAQDKNNIFGWGAVDWDPYNKAWSFESYADCIMTVASKMSKSYFSIDGEYFTGHCENGDVVVTTIEVNENYCSQDTWANKVATLMWQIGIDFDYPEGLNDML